MDTKGAAENALSQAKTYADGKANEAESAAKTYTDESIASLINSAPSTLDTLGEIAAAMSENEDVVEALDEAIGKKANSDHAHKYAASESEGGAALRAVADENGENIAENFECVKESIQSLQITTTETLTLTVADWADNSQTVACTIDTSKRNVIDVLPESVAAWAASGVLGISETETGITFQCDSVPTADLYFRVTSMEVN